ncbi:hypothetical protein EV126DRAFT_443217 [Verticillium dahliae]|nr:hypothetical protein EV126DRAFT_443217 [Verticillium dahliae]
MEATMIETASAVARMEATMNETASTFQSLLPRAYGAMQNLIDITILFDENMEKLKHPCSQDGQDTGGRLREGLRIDQRSLPAVGRLSSPEPLTHDVRVNCPPTSMSVLSAHSRDARENAVVCLDFGPLMLSSRHPEEQAGVDCYRASCIFEMTLRSIPESERSLSSGSSGYKPTTYEGFDRSPHARRWKRRRASRGDQVDRGTLRRDQPESSDDELTPNPPDTPTPMETRSRRRRRQETKSNQDAMSRQPRGGGEKGRAYCTQKCLLGLVRSGFLDRDCPNIALHTGHDRHDRNERRFRARKRASTHAPHPVNHTEWLQLLRKQLEQSLDDGIRPLYVSGARGVLFQVTMIAYGYTFVGKGTVQAFIRDLEHEAAVYERLRSIQGANVPVFLGAIDLRPMKKIYYYDHRVYVVHLTFLSWGGHRIDASGSFEGKRNLLEKMAVRSLQAVHEHGVVHNDVRVANMLLNLEVNGVMMIDFERAQLVPNKRTPNQEAVGMYKNTGDSSVSSQGFLQDLLMAKMAV